MADAALSGLLVALAPVFAILLSSKLRLSWLLALIISSWHTLFSISYYFYSLSNMADSTTYFLLADLGDFRLKLGLDIIVAITWLLIRLGLNYFHCFLVFNLIGVAALLL